jgi:biotin synthase
MPVTLFSLALDRVRGGGGTTDDLVLLLAAESQEAQHALHAAAYRVKSRVVGRVVFLRGLIEMSNQCRRNCHYCGIRRANSEVNRFTLTAEEIVAAAQKARDFGYGSIVLQGGELQGSRHVDFIADTLEQIHAVTNGELGVTLSLGEQTRSTYHRWREAGAHRYLLRMETTDRDLYRELHPDHPDWERRRQCLDDLRTEGYQVGTGVMIGLPGQRLRQLAEDLMFFRDQDVDMIGMGPYIPHEKTPMAEHAAAFDSQMQVRLGLNMIACTRLLLPDANIASTTALQTLHPWGRELGLLAGANVIMPNVTDTRYRAAYQLYDGKPAAPENEELSRQDLEKKVRGIGESIGYRRLGDAPRANR